MASPSATPISYKFSTTPSSSISSSSTSRSHPPFILSSPPSLVEPQLLQISTNNNTSSSSSSIKLISSTNGATDFNQTSLPTSISSSRRRELIMGGGISLLSVISLLKEPLVSEAREVEVGSYLPPSPSDPSFVVFKASTKDTPALRAGNVQPYEFLLPPSWKQLRVANILSGNYCQPKCAEPWVEVKFEGEKQGKVQVVASPLIRLTNKPNATIEEIGTPEKLIASLGPFVTGNTLDPDELLEISVEKQGDQTYYKYVLETPFALTGSHNLAKATAKGNTVVLFVVSANDKQWSSSKNTLKSMLDSFQV